MPTRSWNVLWMLLAFVGVLFEGIALGRPELGDTLTESVRLLRFDPVGRFVVLPLWVWLTWHWILRPSDVAQFTWRDLAVLALGTAIALLDSLRR